VALSSAPDRQPRQHPITHFFTDWMPFLPPNQQRQSTEGTPAKALAHQQSVFQEYDSEQHLSEFYPQDGSNS